MPVMERLLAGAPADLSAAEVDRWAEAIDLGQRAAAGDRRARKALAKPGGGAMVDDRGVALYLDQATFGEVVGANPSYLRRLRPAGRLIEAEVCSGRVWGWSIGRVILWGIEYGYLTPSLDRIISRRGRLEAVAAGTVDLDARPHWRFDSVAYLTLAEVADFLGITADSVYQARMRGTGPIESIRIGETLGWDLEKVKAFNRRRLPHLRAVSQDPGPAII